jgi:hypothetical protein
VEMYTLQLGAEHAHTKAARRDLRIVENWSSLEYEDYEALSTKLREKQKLRLYRYALAPLPSVRNELLTHGGSTDRC